VERGSAELAAGAQGPPAGQGRGWGEKKGGGVRRTDVGGTDRTNWRKACRVAEAAGDLFWGQPSRKDGPQGLVRELQGCEGSQKEASARGFVLNQVTQGGGEGL